ncbi:host-nuclease inhibitor Gam family protein [Herminiimonas arsenitoxidans]|uniref:host-nuclease inhibitor Gam family protein n=1 Tax=Herminiimonas arsenitoxidans TaxID=1809410 RepID=UPI00097062A4|nr:host-nuclease inhibitor Gam family protein [Herminiimonas arsenitoxidans]
MASKQRMKAAASQWVAQSQDDAASTIRLIGEVGRDVSRLTANMNDEIAAVTQKYQELIAPKQERLVSMQSGVQVWCEANRDKLTNSGKTKSANLITGNIMWRQRPPSVTIRGADSVIETLKKLALGRFVRTKDEINKDAILNEQDAVRGIAGISIVTGVEDFVIEPFEQEATQ